MNRIAVIVLFAYALVELVSSQTNCTDAQMQLVNDTSCQEAAITLENVDVVCMGTCRTLLDTIIASCDNELTTSIYSTAISTLCNNGSTDTSCEAVVDAVSNTCSGITFTANPELCPTCETELSAVMAACENTSDQNHQMLSAAYETACLSGPECTAALQGFSTNLTCTNALATSAQEIYCAGFCQELVNNVFSICPNNAYISTVRGIYNQNCGNSDSDHGSVLKAPGIIILLFLSIICAVVL